MTAKEFFLKQVKGAMFDVETQQAQISSLEFLNKNTKEHEKLL